MKKKILFIVFLVALFAHSFIIEATSGYEIKVKVKGFENQDVILGYHYRKALNVKDTAQFDKSGIAIFKGVEPLPGGIYLFYFPNGKYYDILIDKEQHFTVESDTLDFLKHAKITGSKESELFFKLQNYMEDQGIKAEKIRNDYKEAGDNQQLKDELSAQLTALNTEVKEYLNKTYTENKGLFISSFVNAIREPEIPEFEIPEDTHNRDSALYFTQMSYIKEHYFDNIDLADYRLIRTPFFLQKVETYFNNSLINIPDTVADAAIKVIEKCRPSSEMFRYMLPTVFNMINESKIMGMEAAMVALAEKYYLTGEADWSSEEFIKDLQKRVTELKPTLLGKKAHELKMENPNGEFFRLHEVNAKITILVFYEPNCSHCKKEIPKLYNDIYLNYRDKGVNVFAVYNLVDKEEWTKFIEDNSMFDWINVYDRYQQTNFRQYFDIKTTPTIFILDKDKKIIAKKIETEQISEFLEFTKKKKKE
jgi:thiol-disulfide isomerase/thioredoxin